MDCPFLSVPKGLKCLTPGFIDRDADDVSVVGDLFDADENEEVCAAYNNSLRTEEDFNNHAEEVYAEYSTHHKRRFKWLRPGLFDKNLAVDLEADAKSLFKVLETCGKWEPNKDAKLDALYSLVMERHPKDKVLIFSQFADTVKYLEEQLQARNVEKMKAVTGDTSDPTALAWRFSPKSNEKAESIEKEQELRVLIATDVLSEGQNLQDCSIIVNYDLPMGHHPPCATRRTRGPYRTNGGKNPLLFISSGGRCGADYSLTFTGAPPFKRKRGGSGHG